MFKLHIFNLDNKGYTEQWINEMDDKGFAFKGIKFKIFYQFEKKENQGIHSEYRLIPIEKESFFDGMSEDDLNDFVALSKKRGWESVGDLGLFTNIQVIKKPVGAESQEIYDNVSEELNVMKKLNKFYNKSFAINFLLFLMLFFMNRSTFKNYAEYDMSIFYSGIFMFSMVNLFSLVNGYIMSKKYQKMKEKVEYMNSKIFSNILNLLVISSTVVMVGGFTIGFCKDFYGEKIFTISNMIFMIVLISMVWGLSKIYREKIKKNPNYTKKQKRNLMIGVIIAAVVLSQTLGLFYMVVVLTFS